MPPNERSRPGQRRPLEEVEHHHDVDASSVDGGGDVWERIKVGWSHAGDALPRAGSVAWRLLDDADPVKAAATAVADLDASTELVRHGPSWARAMAEAAT